jgi:hypothetical protein
MDLKFYKSPTKPSSIKEGSIWFDTTNKRITLIGGSSDTVFGSDIDTASYESNILKIYKVGSTTPIQIDLSSLSKVSDIENTLATKLNKIKVSGTEVNSTSLNLKGSGGTTVSASGSDITISSPTTFDASAITSGTIDIARIPKAALERLYIVTTEAEALSNTEISEGDTVQVTNNSNHMYFCVDDSATTFATKFREYTAATTITVDWDDINNKPTKLSDFTDDLGAISSVSLYEARSTGTQISGVRTANPYLWLTTTTTNGTSNSSSGIQLYGSSNVNVYSYGSDKIYISGPNLSDYLTSSDLDGYAKTTDIPSLSGYATQDWVTNKGYVTSSGITSGSLALASSSTGTSNATSTSTPYLNLVLNGSETGSIQITGSNNVSVSGANGKLTISGPDLSKYLTSAPVTSVNGYTGDVTLTIPTKVSQLTNDANYITSAPVTSVNGQTGAVTLTIPDAYTLPKATSSTLGGIKIGTNLSINSSGVLSATNTTYSAGTGLSLSGTTFNVGTSYSQSGKNYPVKESGGNLYVNVPWTDTTYPTANSATEGVVKVDIGLSETSTNPVRNCDIYDALANKADVTSVLDYANLIVGVSKLSEENYTSTLTNPWINFLTSPASSTFNSIKNYFQLKGDGGTTVTWNGSDTITISSTSSSSYTLPTASATTLGGIKVGNNLTISNGVLSASNTTYDPGNGLTLSGTTFNVGLGYTTSGKNYKVQQDSSKNLYVNVPWTDTNTTYDVATTSSAGLMSADDKKKLDNFATETWTFEMEDGTTVSKTICTA